MAFALEVNTAHSSSLPISVSGESKCRLTVGWGDWPPYQYLSSNSEPQGIQIKLLKQIANEANCELTFKLQTFTQNQQSIKEGSIDVTLDTTITESRKAFAYFSQPYRNEVMALYVRPKFMSECKINPLSIMIKNGFRMGVTKDNLYGTAISEIQRTPDLDKRLVYRDKNSQHFELFKNDLIDGLIEDPAVMAYKMRNDIRIGDLTACKIAVSSSPVSLMFSKRTITRSILNRIDEAIAKVKQTSDYKKDWAW